MSENRFGLSIQKLSRLEFGEIFESVLNKFNDNVIDVEHFDGETKGAKTEQKREMGREQIELFLTIAVYSSCQEHLFRSTVDENGTPFNHFPNRQHQLRRKTRINRRSQKTIIQAHTYRHIDTDTYIFKASNLITVTVQNKKLLKFNLFF